MADEADYLDTVIAEFAQVGANRLFDAMFARGGAPTTDPLTLDLAPLAASMQRIHGTSQDILDAIRRPTRTAADELLDRAEHAYSNGWHEEALRDAEQSIATYPYLAAAHLVKALAAFSLGRTQATVEGLLGAMRYGVGEQTPVAATAALLMADLADAAGTSESAVQVLDEFRAAHGEVPEVALALHLRAPDHDGYFRAAIDALHGTGLVLGRVHAPSELLGLTDRLDDYLAAQAQRELLHDHHLRAATALAAQANATLARSVPIDPGLLAYLSWTRQTPLPTPRTAATVRELAAICGIIFTTDWLSDAARFAAWLRPRIDEFALQRTTWTQPDTPFADLSPLVFTLDELLILHGTWTAAMSALAQDAVTDASIPPSPVSFPAFVVPLVLAAPRSPMFAVADAVARAPARAMDWLPAVRVDQTRRTRTARTFSITSAAHAWALVVDTRRHSAHLTGGREALLLQLAQGGAVDLPLVIDDRLHTLRVDRPSSDEADCTLSLDGVRLQIGQA
ncbi:hypothetical protein SAMN05428970_1743 [Agromyces sp. CF514]|uniref:tetratricopeptide repeat protein n=1 Tax=Agromyces sp. CF514 TaxID=1881031 RepID=UPI0008EBD437|nr:hypothetical protein [Agromyces sp. CF514]SFR74562.1 hypothetical protein SAMN05428970_1743 [Agromyces sp. CF514]